MVELLDPLVVKDKDFLAEVNVTVAVIVGKASERYFVNKMFLTNRARNLPASFFYDEYPGRTWKDQEIDLIDFYVLASTIDDPIAMHAVMRAFIHDHIYLKGEPPQAETLVHAAAVLPRDSPLDKLLLDLCAWCSWTGNIIDEAPKAIAVRVMEAILERLKKGEDRKVKAEAATCCDYHELEDGMSCVSKKRKRDKNDE